MSAEAPAVVVSRPSAWATALPLPLSAPFPAFDLVSFAAGGPIGDGVRVQNGSYIALPRVGLWRVHLVADLRGAVGVTSTVLQLWEVRDLLTGGEQKLFEVNDNVAIGAGDPHVVQLDAMIRAQPGSWYAFRWSAHGGAPSISADSRAEVTWLSPGGPAVFG